MQASWCGRCGGAMVVAALAWAAAPSPAPGQATAVAPRATAGGETVAPVPRDEKWMKRHELINSRAVPGEVDLIFIGDSITQGWEGAGKEAWARHFAPLKAMNAGIGGDRTQHVLWRLENGNVAGIAPKVAVVMIGTNNAAANAPEQTAAGIEAIVASLRAKLPRTKILLLAIFPRGADENDPLRRKNAAVNAMIEDLDDGEHVFYLDIGPRFLTEAGVLEKEVMPDRLHLTPKAYEIWAESIRPRVVELMDR